MSACALVCVITENSEYMHIVTIHEMVLYHGFYRNTVTPVLVCFKGLCYARVRIPNQNCQAYFT